jgi:glycerol-3-phosphate dehydrogenase (NAD(P)+)
MSGSQTSKRLAVLGDGSWGTAVAVHLAQDNRHQVTMWSPRPENADQIRQFGENRVFLPGVMIPRSLHITGDVAEAVEGADSWISVIPTQYLRNTLKRFEAYRGNCPPIVSLSKGIELATFRRPSQIIAELMNTRDVAVMAGPSHAEEVSRGMPTSVAVAGDPALACHFQGIFSAGRFRVYTNDDLIGTELAGALKNVIAIAAGMCDGFGFGDNAKSALVTRGLVEMARFGMTQGASLSTFHGLAGMGDLITTCFSIHGRNRRVGEALARGKTLQEIQSNSPMVCEGVATSNSVYERSQQMNVDLPIMQGVYRILYEQLSPMKAFEELMARTPRSEHFSSF